MAPHNKGRGKAYRWLCDHISYEEDNCLIWPFSHGDGYGSVSFNGVLYRAHRFMCILAHGAPPTKEHQATHSCGNGHHACVNPKHLSWKTNGENQLDRRKQGTKNAGSRSRFTQLDDAKLRKLSTTKTQIELAKMFAVSRSTIQYRLYGGSYKRRRNALISA